MKSATLFCLLLIICSSSVFAANQLDESIPTELFDIRMDLESTVIADSHDLKAVITYESFGRIPTHVDLNYSVYNEAGEKVYTKLGEIVVEVEEIQRVSFDDLNLLPGKYKFIFKTMYNADVGDEFIQFFEVEKPKSSKMLLWIGILATVIGLALFFAFKRKK